MKEVIYMPIHVVLVEPEIPQNTGNIARTCAAIGAILHLVKPLGFSVEDRYLKRAGLDYWHLVDIEYHDSIDELFNKYPEGDFIFLLLRELKNIQMCSIKIIVFWYLAKKLQGCLRIY